MDSIIHIGVDGETVAALGATIIQILESGQEQKTLRTALEALKEGTSVSNVSISGCSISGEGVFVRDQGNTGELRPD